MNSWVSLPEWALSRMNDWGLLALRIWVGQEFLLAGHTKLDAGVPAPAWFAGLSFPFPHTLIGTDFNWLMAGVIELGLGIALMLGLMTQLSALGLLYITYVAVYTVHFDLGWAGWNQIETDQGLGFKVPLMLGIMLLALVTQGGGRLSVDRFIRTHRTGHG